MIIEIENVIVISQDFVFVKIFDIVSVVIGKEFCIGVVIQDGVEMVFGIMMMLIGENLREVVKNVVLKFE